MNGLDDFNSLSLELPNIFLKPKTNHFFSIYPIMLYIALIYTWKALDYPAKINRINITILILVFLYQKGRELE